MTDKKPEEPMYYRTIAQTKDGLTITANTKKATTEEQAKADIMAHVLPLQIRTNLLPFVTLPIASEAGWARGDINFCPRCGYRMEYIEDSYSRFECDECHAECDVNITVYDEPEEETSE